MGDSQASALMDGHSDDMDFTLVGGSSKRRNDSLSSDSSDDASKTLKGAKVAKIENDESIFIIKCDETKLTKVSPVKVTRWLNNLLGSKYTVRPEPSGNLVVTCPVAKGTILVKLKDFEGFAISVERFIPVVSQKGIIHGVDIEFTADDLKDGLQDPSGTKISEIRRLGNTKSVVITFKGTELPEFVFFGYLRFSVKLFIPTPIRCFKCQKFGHIAANCKKDVRCSRCGENHDIKNCNSEATEKCCNCGMNHKASSKDCRFYQERQTVLKVKPEQRISYSDAVKRVNKSLDTKTTTKSDDTLKITKPKSSSGVRVSSPRKPVVNSSQDQPMPFNWDQFAAFMMKAGMMFVGKNYQENDLSGRVSMMAEIMTECFQVSVDERRTSNIFKDIMSRSVKTPDTI